MRFTASQVTKIVNGAVSTGRIPPWRRQKWHRQISAGGPMGASALVNLLSMAPAGAEVAAKWARDVHASMPYEAARRRDRRSNEAAAVTDRQLYDTLFGPPPGGE